MNGADLPVADGAPRRLHVERQLAYKHAKYLVRIKVIASFARRRSPGTASLI
jgi:DMSO/TMAO reductase YedYZ molybdopterin-dependent catalytic subunit